MSQFSRRVDIHVFKDKPFTAVEWAELHPGWDVDDLRIAYQKYLDRYQPFWWHAKGMNGEIVAGSNGERFFNEADCWDNVALNYADDTTVYAMPMYGDDRTERWMRFGATDRQNIDTSGGEDMQ